MKRALNNAGEPFSAEVRNGRDVFVETENPIGPVEVKELGERRVGLIRIVGAHDCADSVRRVERDRHMRRRGQHKGYPHRSPYSKLVEAGSRRIGPTKKLRVADLSIQELDSRRLTV